MVVLDWSWEQLSGSAGGVMTVWLDGAARNLPMPTFALAHEFAQVLHRELAAKYTAGRQSLLDEVMRIKP